MNRKGPAIELAFAAQRLVLQLRPEGLMTGTRRYPRFSLRMPVLCEGPGVQGSHTLGLTHNVSEGGLMVEVAQALPAGTSTSLRLLAGDRIVRADALVVWTAQTCPERMGLRLKTFRGAGRLAWESLMTFQGGSTPRASIRIPLNLDVSCVIPPDTRLQGRAENISDGGLLVALPQTVIPQTRMTVAVPPFLVLPPVDAEVVWMLTVSEVHGVLHALRFLSEDRGREMFLFGALFRRLLD